MKLKDLLRSLVMVSALNAEERKAAFDVVDDCVEELIKKVADKAATKNKS